MDMRTRVSAALKDAMKAKEADRLSTLRLINAAIKDRDIALRGDGEEGGVGDAEVLGILGKMVKQRQESARAHEEGGRPEPAEKERGGKDRGQGEGHGGAEGPVYRPDGLWRCRADGEGSPRLRRDFGLLPFLQLSCGFHADNGRLTRRPVSAGARARR